MIDAYAWFVGGNPQPKGETNDKTAKEKDGFDVIDFSFGVENQVNVGSSSGGLGSGRVQLDRMEFTKNTDTATTDMVLAACTGAHIDEFHLSIRKGGADAKKSGGEFVHVQMNNVVIESVKWAGSDGDETFKDSVVLAFASIKIDYKKQDFKGALTDGGTVQWSQTQNEAVL
ncbi:MULTISPECIES: type VI secretion system tube protein Hcp [Rhodobacterales]|uniref:type VI secretion system tube protein Hcp n=1 Tax=Roseobacter sp. N2S TaxID=2663844 RepID=UPI0028591A3F|nr:MULTISPECIES: type VI secretion system tube protein Hcp [Rhodobacterales]MDR6265574.1 type VI secretion system secreted protein Hcp [Roseobacter sp. N2S]